MSDVATYLYRHFDKDGQLLYVGISLSAMTRISQHRESSPWFDLINNITLEKFASRKAALRAETDAIQIEKPLYNIQKRIKKVAINERKLKLLDEAYAEVTSRVPELYEGKQLLSPEEAAVALDISKNELMKMGEEGRIEVFNFGKRLKRFRAKEINRILMYGA
jgi:predicted GIY-YIG superfamily endonuclease